MRGFLTGRYKFLNSLDSKEVYNFYNVTVNSTVYYVQSKSCPIFYIQLLHKIGKHFLDIQYGKQISFPSFIQSVLCKLDRTV